MNALGQSPLLGSAASLTFLMFSIVPEVPPIAQWICLGLSALASILTIIKNANR